jgi:hypothetical protein
VSDEENRRREVIARDVRRSIEAVEMERAAGLTDDTCYRRCENLHDWFVWECRGLMSPEEAHEVLDMLLNRLASDGMLAEEAS